MAQTTHVARVMEPVRLIIWDLDDTFWKGTLAEGNVEIIPRHCELIRLLARRGIISTICSKNDPEAAALALRDCGVWDYFVMPSVTWEAKGQRLRDLVASFKLRPSTALFIDDNHLNREEARKFVPELQVSDPSIIVDIDSLPQFAGKSDPEMSRLRQYRLLQSRQVDRPMDGSARIQFLRECDIVVSINCDFTAHIDRAIELINRTNQLNFIKSRLPEDSVEAQRILMATLSEHNIQAGLIRVVDRYGDHGLCGIYILRWPSTLLQFAFSCRVLGLGIEQWLYQRLHSPFIRTNDGLQKLFEDAAPVDWIRIGDGRASAKTPSRVSNRWVVARGGCDLQAVSHYLNFQELSSACEFNFNRCGCDVRIDHSMFLRYAINGVPEGGLDACKSLGYQDGDFRSSITTPRTGNGFWLLSFWADGAYALYRHRESGVIVPWMARNWHDQTQDLTKARLEDFMEESFRTKFEVPFQYLKKNFDFLGLISETLYKDNLRLILSSVPHQTRVFILGANEYMVDPITKRRHRAPQYQALNQWTRSVARWRRNVTVLSVRDFIHSETEVHDWSHFDRMVYFRIYQDIERELTK